MEDAEQRLCQEHLLKDYLPIEGDREFLAAVIPLLFGSSHSLPASRLLAFQTLGGTGALRMGGELLAHFVHKKIYIPDPTWPNHANTFMRCGMSVETYPYLDKESHHFNFNALYEAFQKMPEGSIVLLQASCHNPTGYDPTFEQWKELSALIKKKRMISFFDCAYQGFGDGFEQDVQSIRYFASQGHEMLVAYSFAKNLGIYGERAGFLCMVLGEDANTAAVASQVKSSIRGSYSNPPLHAARLVTKILTSPDLYKEWQDQLTSMRGRLQEIHRAFMAKLLIHHDLKDFFDVRGQKGLFFMSHLTPEQVKRMREEKAIYMLSSGRINLSGLNPYNIEYVADSLAATIKTKKP